MGIIFAIDIQFRLFGLFSAQICLELFSPEEKADLYLSMVEHGADGYRISLSSRKHLRISDFLSRLVPAVTCEILAPNSCNLQMTTFALQSSYVSV